MHIPTDGYRWFDMLGVGLIREYFHRFVADEFDLGLSYWFELFEVVDYCVDVVDGFAWHWFLIMFMI